MRLRDLLRRVEALEVGGGGSGEIFTAAYTFDGLPNGDSVDGTLADSTGPFTVDGDELVAEVDCIVQAAVFPQPWGVTGEGTFGFGIESDAEVIGGGSASFPHTGPYVPMALVLKLQAGQRFSYTANASEGDVAASGAFIQIAGVVS